MSPPANRRAAPVRHRSLARDLRDLYEERSRIIEDAYTELGIAIAKIAAPYLATRSRLESPVLDE